MRRSLALSHRYIPVCDVLIFPQTLGRENNSQKGTTFVAGGGSGGQTTSNFSRLTLANPKSEHRTARVTLSLLSPT